jgi:hypothetical protein
MGIRAKQGFGSISTHTGHEPGGLRRVEFERAREQHDNSHAEVAVEPDGKEESGLGALARVRSQFTRELV